MGMGAWGPRSDGRYARPWKAWITARWGMGMQENTPPREQNNPLVDNRKDDPGAQAGSTLESACGNNGRGCINLYCRKPETLYLRNPMAAVPTRTVEIALSPGIWR